MASVSMSMIGSGSGSGSGSGGGGCSQFPEREKKGSRNKRKFRADPPPPLPLVPCIDCNANSDTNDSDKGFVVMNGWKMGCPSMNDSFRNSNDGVDVNISTSATHNHDHASSCYGFCNCCKAQHEHQPNSCNCSGPEEIHREPGYGCEEFSPSREQLQEEEDLEGLPEADWNEITESQLEDLLLTNLDTIYKSAIKKIAACGYTEDVTLKAVLKYGRCYGSKDILSNIIDNAMAYFSNSHDASSKDHSFEDLQQLEKYALAELVCILREAEAEAETKAEAAAGAAVGTGTLNSQPRPFNRKSSELRSYSPGRAQYESSQRSHRVASSSLPQRSHSVSPQRNRLTRVRKDNYDVRQRTGQTLPQKTRHESPLQWEWGSSQSTRTLPKESANAFPDHFTDRDYINILQSMGQVVHIFKPSGEITYWYDFSFCHDIRKTIRFAFIRFLWVNTPSFIDRGNLKLLLAWFSIH